MERKGCNGCPVRERILRYQKAGENPILAQTLATKEGIQEKVLQGRSPGELQTHFVNTARANQAGICNTICLPGNSVRAGRNLLRRLRY